METDIQVPFPLSRFPSALYCLFICRLHCPQSPRLSRSKVLTSGGDSVTSPDKTWVFDFRADTAKIVFGTQKGSIVSLQRHSGAVANTFDIVRAADCSWLLPQLCALGLLLWLLSASNGFSLRCLCVDRVGHGRVAWTTTAAPCVWDANTNSPFSEWSQKEPRPV